MGKNLPTQDNSPPSSKKPAKVDHGTGYPPVKKLGDGTANLRVGKTKVHSGSGK